MAFLNWLAVTIFNWLFGKLVEAVKQYIHDREVKHADEKENAQAVEDLKNAKTEKERHDATRDITRDSF